MERMASQLWSGYIQVSYCVMNTETNTKNLPAFQRILCMFSVYVSALKVLGNRKCKCLFSLLCKLFFCFLYLNILIIQWCDL